MMLGRYLEVLPELLKKSPEIEITKLEVKTSEGDFTGKAKVSFDGAKSDASQNILAMANAITANAELKAGEGLVRRVAVSMMRDKIAAEQKEQGGEAPSDKEIDAITSGMIDEQLSALVAQNVLVKEAGNYMASASYKAGQMVLNGRPLSLQNLLQ